MYEQMKQNNNYEDNSGKVWIEKGKLHIQNPGEGGNLPAVTPIDGLDILVNGLKIEEKTTVNEKDVVELKIKPIEETKGMYKIKITAGGLAAELEMTTSTIRRQFIADSLPENEWEPLLYSEETQEACPFTLEELKQKMAGQHIQYGIKQDLLQQLPAKPENGRYVIAEGDPPGDTVDEWVEVIVKKDSPAEKSESDNDVKQKIDFRNVLEILSVDAGTFLAIKHPGIQGAEGKKVTGESLAAASPKIYKLSAGPGAEISEDGSKAVAKISGSPIVKKLGDKYIVDVKPIFQKNGDVDMSSGNIRFKGDVVISGTVREGMSVQASGKVDIHGMTFESKISGMDGIRIRQNVTGTTLTAGGNNIFHQSFFKILDPIYSDFTEITNLLQGLAKHPKLQQVKTGQLVQVLVDKKYPRLPVLINDAVKFAEDNSFGLPQEITELMDDINRYIRGLNLLKLESDDQLKAIVNKMGGVHQLIESVSVKKSNISFAYAVNSKIEASGDVLVDGRGCINTTIRAGGKVNIAGVFRGGEIFAGGDVTINEAGSELGAKTLIRTDGKKRVYINKANEGVRVQVGDRQLNFPSMQNNVLIRLAKDGSIAVSTNQRK